MAFRLDTPYYPIGGPRPEATFGAVVEMLLKTRLKLHLETNRQGYDEDVNAYLAGLLVSYIDPRYLSAVSEVLSQYDIDVYESAAKAQDNYQIYWIYKVNADDLLLTVGLFRRFWQNAPKEIVRLKQYYSIACDYQKKIYRRSTAVGEIQLKLADSTERYLAILAGARADYMRLLPEMGTEELEAFRRDLNQYEKNAALDAKRDEFLDAYSAWRKGPPDPKLNKRLVKLVEELKTQDPSFPAELFLKELF